VTHAARDGNVPVDIVALPHIGEKFSPLRGMGTGSRDRDKSPSGDGNGNRGQN